MHYFLFCTQKVRGLVFGSAEGLVYKQENNRSENICTYMSVVLKDDLFSFSFSFLNNSQSQETQSAWLNVFSQDSISSLGGKLPQSHLYLTVCPSSSPPSLLICISKYTLNYVSENGET